MRKPFRPVSAVASVERDRVAGLMDLETVAVELDLIDPAHTLGQALMQDRLAGRDEGRRTRHARDMPSLRCFNNFRYRIFDLLGTSEYGAEAVNRAAHHLELFGCSLEVS